MAEGEGEEEWVGGDSTQRRRAIAPCLLTFTLPHLPNFNNLLFPTGTIVTSFPLNLLTSLILRSSLKFDAEPEPVELIEPKTGGDQPSHPSSSPLLFLRRQPQLARHVRKLGSERHTLHELPSPQGAHKVPHPPSQIASSSGYELDLHGCFSSFIVHYEKKKAVPWFERTWAPLFISFDSFLSYGWTVMGELQRMREGGGTEGVSST